MGNSLTRATSDIRGSIMDEFVQALVYSDPPYRDKHLISLKRLISIRQLDFVKYDLCNFALLYMIDADHDGLFSVYDLLNLAYFHGMIETTYALKSNEVSAHVLAFMSYSIKTVPHESLIAWMSNVVSNIDGVSIINSITCVPESAIRLLHGFLKIEAITRDTFERFMETCKITAKQLGLIPEDQEETFRSNIPLLVIQTFTSALFKGYHGAFSELDIGSVTVPTYTEIITPESYPNIEEEFVAKCEKALVEARNEWSSSDSSGY